MKQLFVIMLSFLSGYLSATIFDLSSLSAWVGGHFSSKSARVIEQAKAHETLPKPKFEFYTILANDKDARHDLQNAAQAQAAHADLPSPPTGIPGAKESASIKAATVLADNHLVKKQEAPHAVLPLPNTHAHLNEPSPNVEASTAKPAINTATHDSYLVQVAAYKTLQDAERLKANLVLKGHDVQITLATQQNGRYYRVVLGPFDSRDKASQAQVAIAQSERITGMIRRSDA